MTFQVPAVRLPPEVAVARVRAAAGGWGGSSPRTIGPKTGVGRGPVVDRVAEARPDRADPGVPPAPEGDRRAGQDLVVQGGVLRLDRRADADRVRVRRAAGGAVRVIVGVPQYERGAVERGDLLDSGRVALLRGVPGPVEVVGPGADDAPARGPQRVDLRVTRVRLGEGDVVGEPEPEARGAGLVLERGGLALQQERGGRAPRRGAEAVRPAAGDRDRVRAPPDDLLRADRGLVRGALGRPTVKLAAVVSQSTRSKAAAV